MQWKKKAWMSTGTKVYAKKKESEELTFGAVAQELKAEGNVWSYSFYHYLDGGAIEVLSNAI